MDFFALYEKLKKNVDRNKKDESFSVVSNDLSLKPKFFKYLIDTRKWDWVSFLYEKDCFKIESIFNNKICPEIDYLFAVSRVDEKYHDILLEVILDFLKSKKPEKNNSYFWIKFVDIICNIPTKKLRDFLVRNDIQLLELVDCWLHISDKAISYSLYNKLLKKYLNEKDLFAQDIILSLLSPTTFQGEYSDEVRFENYGSEDVGMLTSLCKESVFSDIGNYCEDDFILGLFNVLNKALLCENFRTSIDKTYNDISYRFILVRKGISECFSYTFEIREIQEMDKIGLGVEAIYKAGKPFLNVKEIHADLNKELIKSIKSKIKIDSTSEYEALVKSLLDSLDSDYSYMSIRSIANSHKEDIYSAIPAVIYLIREILEKYLMRYKNNSVVVGKLLNQLIENYKFPLLRRFACYILIDYFQDNKQYFWNLLEKVPDIFHAGEYGREPYECLEKNEKEFDKIECEALDVVLSQKPWWLDNDEDKEGDELWLKRQRLKYYKALEKNKFFEEKLNVLSKELKMIPEKIEPPSVLSHVTFQGSGESLLSEKDILELVGKKDVFVNTLNNLKDEDRFSPEQKTIHATETVLQACIAKKPDIFISILPLCKHLRIVFADSLLEGFMQAFVDGKDISWVKLFEFIESYINGDYFKTCRTDKNTFVREEKYFFISTSASLLRSGLGDKPNAIDGSLYSKCFELFNLLSKENYGFEIDDATVNSVINAPLGKTMEAYFRFLKKLGLLEEANSKSIQKYKNFIESLLNAKKPEMYTLFGRYFNAMYCLDAKWAKKKIKSFEAFSEDDICWKGFFQGYIWYISHNGSNNEIFDILRPQYFKAIELEDNYDNVDRIIATQAAWRFVFADEVLESKKSLIGHIVKTDNLDLWNLLIDKFSSYLRKVNKDNKEEYSKLCEKIVLFWNYIFLKKENLLSRELYERMVAFVSVFTQIDKDLEQKIIKIFTSISNYSHMKKFFTVLLEKTEEQNKDCIIRIMQVVADEETNNPLYYQVKEVVAEILEKLYRLDSDSKYKKGIHNIIATFSQSGLDVFDEIYIDNK